MPAAATCPLSGAGSALATRLAACWASQRWMASSTARRRRHQLTRWSPRGAAGCSAPRGTADAAGSGYSQAERTGGWWHLSDANRCYGPGVVTDARDAQIR
jgi:hypothetical protein